MPYFSQLSLSRLNECHTDLQLIFKTVIETFDCSILVGHRGEKEQNKAFDECRSKLKFPKSKHNSIPSMAVDVVPYPLPEWSKRQDFDFFAGYVMGVADLLFEQGMVSHKIRWGGDWNMNQRASDNKFNDLVHFEIVPNTENKCEIK